jgi:hypothetical protein
LYFKPGQQSNAVIHDKQKEIQAQETDEVLFSPNDSKSGPAIIDPVQPKSP